MSSMSQIKKDFLEAMKESGKAKTKPYDTSATVRRIEGKTAWVHIDGGVDETPVQLTIDAKAGDTVKVRVSGGQAWIVGNGTSPPTDDTKATEAEAKAKSADVIAKLAQKTADQAGKTATNYLSWSSQYGLIVSEDATEDPTEMTGGSTRITSDGMDVYKAQNRVAKFSEVSVLGKTDGTNQNLTIDPSTGLIVKRGSTEISKIGFKADDHSGGLEINNTINGSSLFMAEDGVALKGATFKTYGLDDVEHSYTTKLILPSKTTGLTASDGFNRLVIFLHEQWDDGSFHWDDVTHYFDRDGLVIDGSVKSDNTPTMIECGIKAGATTPANSYQSFQISFSKTFTSTPIVTATIQATSSSVDFNKVQISVYNITTTGFYVRVYNGMSSQTAPNISWIAIEQ